MGTLCKPVMGLMVVLMVFIDRAGAQCAWKEDRKLIACNIR